VVTGASRGLGRAIALAFAERGADVVLGARNRRDLEVVGGEIEAGGRRAVIQPTDVTDLGQVRKLADTALARLGRLDVWVNNAGGFTEEPGSTAEWLDVTEAGWDAMLRLNLTAQVWRPGRRPGDARPGNGRVDHLHLVDRQLVRGARGRGHLRGVQGCSQQHHADHGGRARPAPYPRQRDRAGRRGDAADGAMARDGGRSTEAVGVLPAASGRPDVAAAAVYFAADEAQWVSGAVLLVSGGAVMTSDPYRYLMRVNQSDS
jgi:NAD(P)-dependent dehydrogenase (short-subunit alcohol dehydrogenase family)